MADLEFSHFYFSCQKYQVTSQARITKVVGVFTTNPRKLGLYFSEFSTIFYRIYKNQQNTCTIRESNFAQAPGKFSDSQAYP
jgi:hypothetical protein